MVVERHLASGEAFAEVGSAAGKYFELRLDERGKEG
jgi:hypothetical protein